MTAGKNKIRSSDYMIVHSIGMMRSIEGALGRCLAREIDNPVINAELTKIHRGLEVIIAELRSVGPSIEESKP